MINWKWHWMTALNELLFVISLVDDFLMLNSCANFIRYYGLWFLIQFFCHFYVFILFCIRRFQSFILIAKLCATKQKKKTFSIYQFFRSYDWIDFELFLLTFLWICESVSVLLNMCINCNKRYQAKSIWIHSLYNKSYKHFI